MDYVIGVRAPPAEMVGAAAALEVMGYDGVSFGDHRGEVHSPHVWVMLAAIAASTARVTVVSMFANNLFRHPAEFAQAALSVGVLSSGRFEAGLGAGWASAELEAIGQRLPTPAERIDRFEEACRIARPLLRGEACRFDGVHYAANFDAAAEDDAPSVPPPPLVAAVGGPISCRRIAPLVDRVEVMFGPAVAGGSLDFDVWTELTADDLRRRIDIVREAAPAVKVGVGVFVAAGARDEVGPVAALAGTRLQSALIGDPSPVADALRALEGLGVDRIGITPLTATTAERLAPALFS